MGKFLFGMLVGGTIGFFTATLCAAAKMSDSDDE